MFSVRRAALRVLSTRSSSFVSNPRSISTVFPSSLRVSKATPSIQFQRRWASDEAKEVPVSKLQPTSEEEVENAISQDSAATTDGVVESIQPAEPSQDRSENASSESSPAVDEATTAPTEQIEPQEDSSYATQQRGEQSERGQRHRHFDSPRQVEPKKTVYVGNLFFDVTEDDLSRHLSQFGTLEHVRLIRDARGLSKGFGYATFQNVDQATDAISALNQQKFEGRRLNLQFASQDSAPKGAGRRDTSDPRSKNPPSKTLFIGNMSWDMTDRDLNDLFRPIRNVVDVRIAIDRRTGQPRGFAHADFTDIKSAMEAEKILQGKETYGRKLRIDYSYGSSVAPRNQARVDRDSLGQQRSEE